MMYFSILTVFIIKVANLIHSFCYCWTSACFYLPKLFYEGESVFYRKPDYNRARHALAKFLHISSSGCFYRALFQYKWYDILAMCYTSNIIFCDIGCFSSATMLVLTGFGKLLSSYINVIRSLDTEQKLEIWFSFSLHNPFRRRSR